MLFYLKHQYEYVNHIFTYCSKSKKLVFNDEVYQFLDLLERNDSNSMNNYEKDQVAMDNLQTTVN